LLDTLLVLAEEILLELSRVWEDWSSSYWSVVKGSEPLDSLQTFYLGHLTFTLFLKHSRKMFNQNIF